MKPPQVYFVSGVCGVGKSSTLVHLKKLLSSDTYDVRDFDERGVPDGGGKEWHTNETRNWLNIAAENAKNGKSTIVCGFAEPERVNSLLNESHPSAQVFLLHASGDTLRQRLLGRYPTPESIKKINRASGVPLDEFIENNISYAPILHSLFEQANAPIIETDTKTPEQVALEISEYILPKKAERIG